MLAAVWAIFQLSLFSLKLDFSSLVGVIKGVKKMRKKHDGMTSTEDARNSEKITAGEWLSRTIVTRMHQEGIAPAQQWSSRLN